jgi:ATP-dependent DNA helicase RecQ
VMLRREPERAPRSRAASSARDKTPAAAVDLDAAARTVFERLREWRAAAAKEQGVPAYVIFHDATLKQIAQRLPASLADLGTISGVGQTKLERYGQQILDTLATG